MKMICIVCPNGCHLEVTKSSEGITVTGNKCPRGTLYGTEELTAPKRTVTATVKTTSAQYPRVPVKTTTAIPKKSINTLLKKLYTLTLKVPLKRGDVILDDHGIQVVCTRSIL